MESTPPQQSSSQPSQPPAATQPAEPETVTATFGDKGEDPYEVGFVGTKPKDKTD